MLERGLKPADVAAGTRLNLGYVYNLLSGRVATCAGRKKIEKFLSVGLWPESEKEQPPKKPMSKTPSSRFSQTPTAASEAGSQSVDPAAANMSIEWNEICAKIGLTTVVVQVPYSPELWQNSRFEERLDCELRAANLGWLDAIKYFNPMAFFFYIHTEKLAGGMEFIRSNLAGIGLLPKGVKIGYADLESKVCRVFYPVPEKLG
jgi:hypothetical protein